MIIFLAGGVLFFLVSLYKFVRITKNKAINFQDPWIEDELVHNIGRKMSYLPQKKASISAKDFEVYIDSMVPLSRDIEHDYD